MTSERRDRTIGDLCEAGVVELQTGPFGSQLHASDYQAAGVPVVPTEGIRDRRIDHTVLPMVSPTKAKQLQRHKLRTGDILFARRGVQATGRVALVSAGEDGFLCGTGAIRLRVDGNHDVIDPTYLSYILADPVSVRWFKFHAIGATMPNLNESIIRSFRFAIPPLAEQRAIVQILGTLDDKIELNRRMSETLEGIARAFFKSWFVDFDPVRAKAAGRETGLPKEIEELFPDRFVVSEIGEVPEGWGVTTLGEHLEVSKGLSYKGTGLSDGEGLPLHNLNSIYEGGAYKFDGIKWYRGEFRDRHLVVPGDVIVANTEQGPDRLLIGYAASVPKIHGEPGLFSHHLYRVRPKETSPVKHRFIVELLNSDKTHGVVSRYANGTTVNMLPRDALELPGFVLPPAPLIDAYEDLAMVITRRRETSVQQSATLTELRDHLHPLLVSGKLRVPGALASMAVG